MVKPGHPDPAALGFHWGVTGAVMQRKSKGRLASDAERQRAREWVELYRLAQESPNGQLSVNPEDEQDLQTFIRADDPSHLLHALEGFAKNGTFEFVDSFGISEMLLRYELKGIRAGGKTYENAIAEMAEKHHCSVSKIERAVRKPSKRDTD